MKQEKKGKGRKDAGGKRKRRKRTQEEEREREGKGRRRREEEEQTKRTSVRKTENKTPEERGKVEKRTPEEREKAEKRISEEGERILRGRRGKSITQTIRITPFRTHKDTASIRTLEGMAHTRQGQERQGTARQWSRYVRHYLNRWARRQLSGKERERQKVQN